MIPAQSFSSPMNIMALSTALQQAGQRHRALRPITSTDKFPITPAEVATQACEGFDVREVVRRSVDLEMSPNQSLWAHAYIASLVTKWMARIGSVSDEDLADRWVNATSMLTDATSAQGAQRLGEAFRNLQALREEQAELRAIAGVHGGTADFNRRPRL